MLLKTAKNLSMIILLEEKTYIPKGQSQLIILFLACHIWKEIEEKVINDSNSC